MLDQEDDPNTYLSADLFREVKLTQQLNLRKVASSSPFMLLRAPALAKAIGELKVCDVRCSLDLAGLEESPDHSDMEDELKTLPLQDILAEEMVLAIKKLCDIIAVDLQLSVRGEPHAFCSPTDDLKPPIHECLKLERCPEKCRHLWRGRCTRFSNESEIKSGRSANAVASSPKMTWDDVNEETVNATASSSGGRVKDEPSTKEKIEQWTESEIEEFKKTWRRHSPDVLRLCRGEVLSNAAHRKISKQVTQAREIVLHGLQQLYRGFLFRQGEGAPESGHVLKAGDIKFSKDLMRKVIGRDEASKFERLNARCGQRTTDKKYAGDWT